MGGNVSIFKNKHLMIAVLVAPVLSLIGYFGINSIVGEKPQAAEAGKSYQLVEKPNCRYGSGYCGLKNGDFELSLSTKPRSDGQLQLLLESEYPLDGVVVAMAEHEGDEKLPRNMYPLSDDGLTWALDIALPDPERDRLHLVASTGGTLYFGDAATKFIALEDNFIKH